MTPYGIIDTGQLRKPDDIYASLHFAIIGSDNGLLLV